MKNGKKIGKFSQVCLIVLLGVFLAGCDPEESDFNTVHYNGHSYVIYDGCDFDSGMVHDPDCHCRIDQDT